MNTRNDTLSISTRLEISPDTLQSIVEKSKELAGRTEKGYYQIDTAEVLNALLSRFLVDKDFAVYIEDAGHYPEFLTSGKD